jgi:hypothetical protein
MYKPRLLPTLQVITLMLCAAMARADEAFNFTGTLATPLNGDDSVTGQFTLDFTTDAVTGFDFSTPIGTIDPALYYSFAAPFIATSPSADFVIISFFDKATAGLGDSLSLEFETSFASFSGDTFFAGPLLVGGGHAQAFLSCQHIVNSDTPGCPAGIGSYVSHFTSGSATPAAVPEPSALSLFLGCLAILGPSLKLRLRATR